jgi:site-specific recombinase XerD
MQNAPANPKRLSADRTSVWVRISAFLSLKAPLTRITYSGIIAEWCRFLGTEAGTPEAAQAMLEATDLHAIAYRTFLERQPGEPPRFVPHNGAASTGVVTPAAAQPPTTERASTRRRSAKRDGLDATQSNATIHKKFAALRRIYRMLVAARVGIADNPFDADRVPPPPKDAGRKRPTQMIDFDLVMEVIAAPDLATAKGRRDRAILALLFAAGLRRSELVSLRIGDLQRTSNQTTFLYLRYTKAKRDAQQAVASWAAEIVWPYVEERRATGAGPADFLFLSFVGPGGATATTRPLSDTGVYLLFKKYCQSVGAGYHATPHSARATAITKLLADGISHREVQEFSRHASIQMVELYDKRRFSLEQNPAHQLAFAKKNRDGDK